MGPPRCYGASSCASCGASSAAAPAGGRRAAHATEQGEQSIVQCERVSVGQRGRAQRLGRQLDDRPACRKAAPAFEKEATLVSFLGGALCPSRPGAGGPSSSALAIVGHRARARTQTQFCIHWQARGARPCACIAADLSRQAAEAHRRVPGQLSRCEGRLPLLLGVQVRCDVPQVRQHLGTDKHNVSAENCGGAPRPTRASRRRSQSISTSSPTWSAPP
jgi:hypothetical protein